MVSMSQQLKRIPYGISDYEAIREGNYYYVDKTGYLEEIERAGSYLFFLRPRRFGKSLLLSMMETYYDIAKADRFGTFFKDTKIFNAPTPEKNAYLVLKFNFAAVSPGTDSVNDSFLNNIKTICKSFMEKYRRRFSGMISEPGPFKAFISDLDNKRAASDVLLNLLNVCRDSKLKLFILIDEYDNFANTILSAAGTEEYKKLTHGSGFLRAFFNVLKDGTSGSGAPVSRLFVTGVSPITMDDVTSGFNIGKNVSGDGVFNNMLGFTGPEVETMVESYRSAGVIRHGTAELMELMGRWYDHYCFSKKASDTLFNSDMVLYFLDQYSRNSDIPEELVDDNVRIDYGKLKQLIIIDRDSRKMTNGNFSQLKQVIEEGSIAYGLKRSFSVEKLTHPENFISLLYYFGLLTIHGEERGKALFKIPNETVKRLFFEYIKEGYEATGIFRIDFLQYSQLISDMAYDGEWGPAFNYLARQMAESMSLRDLMQGEKAVQAFLAVYLGLGDMFLVHTEQELNKGYADIVLEPFLDRYPDIGYSYIIEIKYIKPGDFSPSVLERAKEEAGEQLMNYKMDPAFRKRIGKTQLIEIILIFSGHQLKHIEAFV